MAGIGVNNFLSIVLGISLILCCSLISYFSQKHIFRKYKDKVKNTIGKSKDDIHT